MNADDDRRQFCETAAISLAQFFLRPTVCVFCAVAGHWLPYILCVASVCRSFLGICFALARTKYAFRCKLSMACIVRMCTLFPACTCGCFVFTGRVRNTTYVIQLGQKMPAATHTIGLIDCKQYDIVSHGRWILVVPAKLTNGPGVRWPLCLDQFIYGQSEWTGRYGRLPKIAPDLKPSPFGRTNFTGVNQLLCVCLSWCDFFSSCLIWRFVFGLNHLVLGARARTLIALPIDRLMKCDDRSCKIQFSIIRSRSHKRYLIFKTDLSIALPTKIDALAI